MTVFADEAVSQQIYEYDGYTVEYEVLQDWGTSKRISVTLTNTGSETIKNWMLYFDPHGEAYGFSGAYPMQTADGITYYENGGYNASIAPNASVSFTYVVDGAQTAPEGFAFCQDLCQMESGFAVSMQVYGQWGSQFNGEILLENTSSKPIYGWELSVKCNFAIESCWAADVTDLGGGEYLLKCTYNSTIPAGGSVNIGLICNCDGTAEVTGSVLHAITADEPRLGFLTGGYTIDDIQNMNIGAEYPVDIETCPEGIVTSIDGIFSDVLILDEESARDAIYSVRRLLGVKDPANTLVLERINEGENDNDFTSYFFDQVYGGLKVYGRYLTVVAKDAGQTLSLDSNYYFGADSFNTTPAISAETIADENPGFDAELVIYTHGDYEDAPILAYALTDGMVTRMISAEDGTLIYETSNASEYQNIVQPDGTMCQSHQITTVQSIQSDTIARELITSRSSDLNVDFESAGSVNTLGAAVTVTDANITAYHFDQYFKGVKVYAREVAVTVSNRFPAIYWLSTNTVQIPDTMSVTTSMTKPNAAAELVIYTWDDQENDAAPQLAYIYTDKDANATMIYLEDGTVLTKQLGKGLDEGCFINTGKEDSPVYTMARAMKLHYFPVTPCTDEDGDPAYKLSVKKTNLGIAKGGSTVVEMRKTDTSTRVTTETINSKTGYFYKPEAVSAYVNAMEVVKWYGVTSGLNHSRYAISGTEYYNIQQGDYVIGINGYESRKEDNSLASDYYIVNTIRNSNAYTCGASLDVMAHEFGHGVFREYQQKYGLSPNATANGINEGYADLFAHFMTKDWTHATQTKGQEGVTGKRNAANPLPAKADFSKSTLSETLMTSLTLEKDCHNVVPYVNKPAYLLATKYLVPTETLTKIYYYSLEQARFCENSTLNSVRSAVLKSAKAISCSNTVVQAITAAYDEVLAMNENTKMLRVNLMDAETRKAVDITDDITVSIVSEDTGAAVAMSDRMSANLNAGWYWITVTSDDYQTYCYKSYMGYNDTTVTIRLVKKGTTTSPVTVRIRDWIDNQLYDGRVQFRRLQSDGTDVLYATYDTSSTETGVLRDVSIPAGYYIISVEGASDIVNKTVLAVPGNSAAVQTAFSDIGVSGSSDYSVFTFISAESNDFHLAGSHFSIGRPDVSHNTDSNSRRALALSSWQSSQIARTTNIYCYNNPCTPYEVYFILDEHQMQELNSIVRNNLNDTANYYTLDIQCINHQKPEQSFHLVLNAKEIADNIVTDGDFYYFTFAALAFDVTSHSFNMTSMYP